MEMEVYFTTRKPAPQDVLDVFADYYRQMVRIFPDLDPCFKPTLDTTLQEWQKACSISDWKAFGVYVSETWAIELPARTWLKTLEPISQKKMYDLCEFIARHGTMRYIPPVAMFDEDRMTTAIFCAICTLLKKQGANVSNITPATPLDEWTRIHYEVFLGPVSALFPNVLPGVEIYHPWPNRFSINAARFAMIMVIAVIAANMTTYWLFGVAIACGLCSLIYLFAAKAASYRKPCWVKFGELRTFGDMSKLIAFSLRRNNVPR